MGLQLLENAAATAAALVAIILAVGPASGAHLNPVITLVDRVLGGLDTRMATGYIGAQIGGDVLGAVVANLMFSEPAIELSSRHRSSGGLWLAEVVATLGLVLVVVAQLLGGGAGLIVATFLYPKVAEAVPVVVVPRAGSNEE